MLLRPMSKIVLLMFSFRSFMISGLTFNSLIYMSLIIYKENIESPKYINNSYDSISKKQTIQLENGQKI